MCQVSNSSKQHKGERLFISLSDQSHAPSPGTLASAGGSGFMEDFKGDCCFHLTLWWQWMRERAGQQRMSDTHQWSMDPVGTLQRDYSAPPRLHPLTVMHDVTTLGLNAPRSRTAARAFQRPGKLETWWRKEGEKLITMATRLSSDSMLTASVKELP